MASNKASEVPVFDNLQAATATVAKPTGAYTVLPTDNLVICGAGSLAITLDANSNSPVYITSIDGATQRASCTILANGNTYRIGDTGPTAVCTRVAGASLWVIIGAIGI